MTDPYEEFRAAPGDNILAAIAAKAREQVEAEAEVEKAQEALDLAKSKLGAIARKELPELMKTAEQTELTTADGIKVTIKNDVKTALPKKDLALRSSAFDWLEENGQEGAIKRQFVIEFDKDQEEWASEFEQTLDEELNVKKIRDVHASTLKSIIKGLLEDGVEVPPEPFGLFEYEVATCEVQE